MKFRLAICALLCAALLPDLAAAEEDCEAVTGVQSSIEQFLEKAHRNQDMGQGTLTLNDVLVGVTEIDAEDQAALAARPLVTMTKSDATHGAYETRGAERISIEGMFAGQETLFRIPKLAKGTYELTEDGATLTYDPNRTVEVGISVIGLHLYKEVHRQVITRQRLAFYFAGNDGSDADRCYIVQD